MCDRFCRYKSLLNLSDHSTGSCYGVGECMSVYFVFLHVLRSFLVVTREVIKRGQKGTKWVPCMEIVGVENIFLKIIKYVKSILCS